MKNYYGRLIREARRRKNLTQSDLGKILNVTDRAVSNWERGTNCVDYSIYHKLNEVLEINIKPYMYGTQERNKEMKLMRFDSINDMDIMENQIDVVLDNIEIEMYPQTIKRLLKKTLYLAMAYVVFYLPRKDSEVEIDWIEVGSTLEFFLEIDDVKGYYPQSIKSIYKKQISQFKDRIEVLFLGSMDEELSEQEAFYKSIAYLAQIEASELLSLLPEDENTVMTLYKIAVNDMSQLLTSYIE